jgi:hypothetical protein
MMKKKKKSRKRESKERPVRAGIRTTTSDI